jgi:8-oxo-dGTP pyrophosphatase MutT (NUDIX family)
MRCKTAAGSGGKTMRQTVATDHVINPKCDGKIGYVRAVFSLAKIQKALGDHRPQLIEGEARGRAAVAVVLRDDAGPMELLFIERARREGDPWSGDIAFPGGRIDEEDASAQAAAERETLEEVGLFLDAPALLGRLNDRYGMKSTTSGIVVSAFVYHVHQPSALTENYEVKEAFWFPVEALLERRRHVTYLQERGLRFPGIVVADEERKVVWGLTYRFVTQFLEILGHTLSEASEAGHEDS